MQKLCPTFFTNTVNKYQFNITSWKILEKWALGIISRQIQRKDGFKISKQTLRKCPPRIMLEIHDFFYFDYNNMLPQQRNQLICTLIKNIDEENSENTHSSQQRIQPKNNLILKKINNRVFKNSHHLPYYAPGPNFYTPIHHVYKLFNTFGLNQTALTTPDFQESFMRTYFYHRIVTRVEKYRNAVVISIVPATDTLQQPPFAYIVEKLKSLGSMEMYRLATLIEQLWDSLMELKNKKIDTIIQEDKESVTKYLNLLGDQMFFVKFGLFKLALSNSLLEFLGYNVDQFCVETIKYRTILFDFLSSNSYSRIITHALTTLKYLMDVDLNKMTHDDYVRMSHFEWTDYVYSKNYKKSFCDIEFIIPVRGILCILLKKIHYQTDELAWKPAGYSAESKNTSKKQVNQKEFELLNKLGAIPSNWLTQGKFKVASYKAISSETTISHSEEELNNP